MAGLILIGVPLGVLTLAGLAVHPFRTPIVVYVSNAAIMIQAALAGLALLINTSLPKEENQNGQVCPIEDSTQMYAIAAIAYLSLAVGAVALAASFTSVRRGGASPGRLLVGLAAAALIVVPFGVLLVAALCGLN